jgi:hypothetical protein
MIDGDTEYESGPFCRHWSDPADCDEVCARCGHPCRQHCGDDGSCDETGCTCQEWKGEKVVA